MSVQETSISTAGLAVFRGRFPVPSDGQPGGNGVGPFHPQKGPPPVFNLPPGVKSLILILVIIHLAQRLMPMGLDGGMEGMFGFFPYRYWLLFHGAWAGPLFIVVVTPLTYMFLHANWMHLGVNVLSLAAFGTAVERMVGAKLMVLLFLLCGFAGAFAEFAVNPTSIAVLIGASAGISGLFAIAFLTMMRAQGLPRRKLVLGIAAVISSMVLLGRVDLDGMPVAWMSHIGGFMAGLLADLCIDRRRATASPIKELGWLAAIIILPLLVLVTNIANYFF